MRRHPPCFMPLLVVALAASGSHVLYRGDRSLGLRASTARLEGRGPDAQQLNRYLRRHRAWARRLAAGDPVFCVRCGARIASTEGWELDLAEGTGPVYRAPACAACVGSASSDVS